MFGSGFEASGDFSDSASQASIGSVATRASTRAGRGKPAPRVSPSVASTVKNKDAIKTVASRPVSVLKPKVGEGVKTKGFTIYRGATISGRAYCLFGTTGE